MMVHIAFNYPDFLFSSQPKTEFIYLVTQHYDLLPIQYRLAHEYRAIRGLIQLHDFSAGRFDCRMKTYAWALHDAAFVVSDLRQYSKTLNKKYDTFARINFGTVRYIPVQI